MCEQQPALSAASLSMSLIYEPPLSIRATRAAPLDDAKQIREA